MERGRRSKSSTGIEVDRERERETLDSRQDVSEMYNVSENCKIYIVLLVF